MKRLFGPLAKLAACALILGFFAGCDAGGTSVADGGIRGTGSSVGPVSGFGSVFVNGVEFFTHRIPGRKVESNDGISSEDDLHEGMILRIEGNWRKSGTGEAESMEYDDTLRGTVSGLQVIQAGKRLEFTIHHQPVIADVQTVFNGKSFTALADGDFVRVSAWRQADGLYRASYIGVNPAQYGDDPIEVEGPAEGIDRGQNRFIMNELIIKYADHVFTGGVTEDTLTPGTYYEVEGTLVDGVLQATHIQPDDFRRYQKTGKDIELAGPLSSDYQGADGNGTFELNGLTIRITKDETELDGLSVDGLKTGLLVQVEGQFVSPTDIHATEIELREGDVEVEGMVDADTFGIRSDGFTVGGVEIRTTAKTMITGDDEKLRIDDLKPAINATPPRYVLVEISGLEKKDEFNKTYVEALTIERDVSDEAEDEYEVEGRLEGINGSDIQLLGVQIRTTEGAFKSPLSLNDLKNRPANEEVVLEVTYGRMLSGTTPYTAISIEEDD
jgi:hypothetical protein